jgi:integrase
VISVKVRERGKDRYLQMYYIDPLTGAYRTKSARTMNRKEAERAAAMWEQELAAKGPTAGPVPWEAFRIRFEDEHLANVATLTRRSYVTALNNFEKYAGKPRALASINPSVFSQWCHRMRTEGKLTPHTVAKNVRHVRSALSWAVGLGLLQAVPKFRSPSTRGHRKMKGRPLTAHEINLLKQSAVLVRPDDYASFSRLIDGLHLSGLRLEEATALSWDSAPVRVDLKTGKFPRFVFSERGHKSREESVIPLTPDFAEYLRKTPAAERRGKVFPVVTRAGRILSEIGEHAGIVVSEDGKFASAHDLRRTFGTRWAAKLRPIALKTIMRHKDIRTTLSYYVDQEADDVGAEIWQSVHERVHDSAPDKEKPASDGSKKPE